MSDCSIERVKRTVIENKLLAALEEDSGQVVILATKQDIEDIHAALCGYKLSETNGNVISWERHEQRCRDLASDLLQLLRQAFPVDHKQWRMTDVKNGHKWGFWKWDEFQSCRICGMVRRADDQNKPCKGKPKLDLRSPTPLQPEKEDVK